MIGHIANRGIFNLRRESNDGSGSSLAVSFYSLCKQVLSPFKGRKDRLLDSSLSLT